MANKPHVLRVSDTKRITTDLLGLESIENQDVLIVDLTVSKSDYGVNATFTAARENGSIIKVRTYAWNIVEVLEKAKNDDAFPIVARFGLVRGRWSVIDPVNPSAFEMFGKNEKA